LPAASWSGTNSHDQQKKLQAQPTWCRQPLKITISGLAAKRSRPFYDFNRDNKD